MVIILMGVSGSGKTTDGRALAAHLHWTFEDADDWHSPQNIAKMRNGEPLTDADRAPWLQQLHDAIREWIVQRRDVVLACSALKGAYRDALREGIADAEALRFVYLKADYATIRSRMHQRQGHFMPESLLKSQFDTLEEPTSSQALIVDASQKVDAITGVIVAALNLRLSPPRMSQHFSGPPADRVL